MFQFSANISIGNILTIVTIGGLLLKLGMQLGKLTETLESVVSRQQEHEAEDSKHFEVLRAQVLEIMKGLERILGREEGQKMFRRVPGAS